VLNAQLEYHLDRQLHSLEFLHSLERAGLGVLPDVVDGGR
jgi:hypothetical protein